MSGRELFQAWQDNRFGWLLYGWAGVFGALLSIPYFQAFHYALKDTVPVNAVATIAASIALDIGCWRGDLGNWCRLAWDISHAAKRELS